ncbi:MAG: nucleotide exchange factor GrpE [Phycisphaerae bacterium]|nr:nucleotide exchange factor GrpE [Phycisphaerae bacterium]
MSRKSKHKKADDTKDAEAPEAVQTQTDRTSKTQSELEALRRERDDLMARLQRVSADYVNYQKRMQRNSSEATEYANAELIKALLPVLDDMERLLEAAKANHGQDDPLYTGMQLVYTKALESLGKFGLVAIEAAGKTFDPDKHSAMAQQVSHEHAPQTVIAEIVKGYQLKDRTIRPSGVVVSASPQEAPNEGPSPQQTEADEQPHGQ